jgi:predicted RNA-binding Zn-ribbon protein involved in translation (DUF1610 family)
LQSRRAAVRLRPSTRRRHEDPIAGPHRPAPLSEEARDRSRCRRRRRRARTRFADRKVGDKALAVAFYVDKSPGLEAKRIDKQVEKILQRQQKYLQAWLERINRPDVKVRCFSCGSLVRGKHVKNTECPVCGEKGLYTSAQAKKVRDWQAEVAVLFEKRRDVPSVPDKKGKVHWLVGGMIELKEE